MYRKMICAFFVCAFAMVSIVAPTLQMQASSAVVQESSPPGPIL